MLALSRRSLFFSVSALGLAGCAAGSSFTLQQALVDALGIATELRANLPEMEILFPTVVGLTGTNVSLLTNAQGTGWLDDAIELLTGLSAASNAAPTDLTVATQDINLVLNTLFTIATFTASTNPAVAAVALIVQAAISLAPQIEALITQITAKTFQPRKTSRLQTPPRTAAMLAAKITVLPPDRARIVLKIKTV